MSYYRPSKALLPDIFAAMRKMLEYSPALQMRLVDVDTAYENFISMWFAGNVYVLGDYAILVDTGSPWYTNKPVLIEELIVKFRSDSGGRIEDAIEALSGIARDRGCVAIAAGDTQIGYMAPRYLAAGFQSIGTQFLKETP